MLFVHQRQICTCSSHETKKKGFVEFLSTPNAVKTSYGTILEISTEEMASFLAAIDGRT